MSFSSVRRLLERTQQTLPGRVWRRYDKSNAGLYAAVIAYTMIFALLPIALALLTMVGLFLRDQDAFQNLAGFLAPLLPGGTGEEIIAMLAESRERSGSLGIVSFVGLLWGGSALFGVIAEAFNSIYGVQSRALLQERLIAVMMIFVFAVLLLLSSVATAVAQILIQLANVPPVAGLPGITLLVPAVSYFVSAVSALALFLAIYYIVPNVKLGIGDVWPGTVLAAVLFLVLIQAFPLYVRFFAGFDRYGAVFGFVFLLLTWFYFIAHALLLGAALNAELRERGARQVA